MQLALVRWEVAGLLVGVAKDQIDYLRTRQRSGTMLGL